MKGRIITVVFVVAALVALAIAGLWWFQKKFMPVFFTQDAVGVIAYEASELFEKNPATTNDEIARMIKSQHEASNINLKIDSNGNAVDLFGKAFRVEHRIQAGKSITTVASSGPDGEFGTRDDISFTHEIETDPQQGAEVKRGQGRK